MFYKGDIFLRFLVYLFVLLYTKSLEKGSTLKRKIYSFYLRFTFSLSTNFQHIKYGRELNAHF